MANNHSGKQRKDSFFNLYFTSTISIALVLFIIGLITFLLVWTQRISNDARENVLMTLVIKDNADPTEVQRIEAFLGSARYVKNFESISKEKALEEHIAATNEDPTLFLGFNPLHASIELHLNAAYANNDSLAWIEKKFTTYESIQEIVYQKDVISSLNTNVRKASLVLLGVAGVLLLISIVLINNTIHISMYSKRFIINTMKLVGAGNWFIRWPFLKRYLLNGLLSAIIALLALGGTIYYIQSEVNETVSLTDWQICLPVVVVVVGMGLLITSVSSLICVSRYLRMKTDDLYYI